MKKLRGTLQVPGDKSISHRALIFSTLTKGLSTVHGLSPAVDCINTIECLKQLGLKFEKRTAKENGKSEQALVINSPGIFNLNKSQSALFAGNSGTTLRLLSGLLAGQTFLTTFEGDESLSKRPMSRLLDHLSSMGAEINYLKNVGFAPFQIQGKNLKAKNIILDLASAQVETAILLAGLQANGTTSVSLPNCVRDHTQRFFEFMGLPYNQTKQIKEGIPHQEILRENNLHKNFDFAKDYSLKTSVSTLKSCLDPFNYTVAADISSAAFFIVAATLLKDSEICLKNLVINPGRVLLINVLKEMGARIEIIEQRMICGEPVADILVKCCSELNSTEIKNNRLASGIDEIPLLALAATFSQGKFKVHNANELRFKESDRLNLTVKNLKEAGANIEEENGGFTILGTGKLKGGSVWTTHDDHRMSMTGTIANLLAENPIYVDNPNCVTVSYPTFHNDLAKLLQN